MIQIFSRVRPRSTSAEWGTIQGSWAMTQKTARTLLLPLCNVNSKCCNCRCKMRMSRLSKVEMSGFMGGRGPMQTERIDSASIPVAELADAQDLGRFPSKSHVELIVLPCDSHGAFGHPRAQFGHSGRAATHWPRWQDGREGKGREHGENRIWAARL